MTATDQETPDVNPETIAADVLELLGNFNPNGIEITDATDITADLSIDSVAVMDLVMTIEDKYNISIPINALTDVRTVGDLVGTVQATIDRESGNGSV